MKVAAYRFEFGQISANKPFGGGAQRAPTAHQPPQNDRSDHRPGNFDNEMGSVAFPNPATRKLDTQFLPYSSGARTFFAAIQTKPRSEGIGRIAWKPSPSSVRKLCIPVNRAPLVTLREQRPLTPLANAPHRKLSQGT